MQDHRNHWQNEVRAAYLSAEYAGVRQAWGEFGAYNGMGDYGHTSPNTRLLLSVGFSGLLDQVEQNADAKGGVKREDAICAF